MAWNGSGVFNRIHNWVTDRDAAIKILASRHDAEDDNFATGIQACLTKDNQSKPTANFAPNADNTYSIGTATVKWTNLFLSTALKFVGASFTTTVAYTAPTADRTITLPDATGTVALTSDVIESGTKMAFFQAAAPTGWTQDATNNDAMLRVVSGTGGGTGGSASPTTGLTATDSHTLTTSEMPAHTHDVQNVLNTTGASYGAFSNTGNYGTVTSTSTGGGSGHTHNITFAPKYIDMIIAVKD